MAGLGSKGADAPLLISDHAVDRLQEYYPGAARHTNPKGLIGWEIREAFRAGRSGKKVPREFRGSHGIIRQRRKKPTGRPEYNRDGDVRDGQVRYVWNEELSRCYVVHWCRGRDKKSMVWVCSTVLRARRTIPPLEADGG